MEALDTTAINRMGTIVQQTGETKLVKANNTPTTGMHLARAHLEEDSFTLQTLVAKENQVANFTWLPAAAPTVNYLMLSIPDDLLTTNATAGPFVLASYARLGCRIRVQVSGIPVAQGALIVWYMPYTTKNACIPASANNYQYGWAQNIVTLTGMQHAILQANTTDSAEIQIDFKQVHDYLKLNVPDATDFIGTLGISVFSQLQATGTTGIAVNVYSQFVDAGFYIPSPTGVSFSRVHRTQPKRKAISYKPNEGMLRKFQRMFLGEEEDYDEGEAEAAFLKGIAGGMLHGLIDKMLPSEMAQSPIGTKLDKPSDTRILPVMVRHTFGYQGHGEGADVVDRHDLIPSSQNLCEPEHFGTKDDEMDLSRMVSRPMLYQTSNWTTTNSSNVILAQGLVCPNDNAIRSDTAFNSAFPYQVFTQFVPTYVDYCSAPFSFWRGGLIFKIQVFATKFHAGKLLFTFHPQVGTVPTTYEQAAGQYNFSMDLSSGISTWTVAIPFRCQTPYLKVPNGHLLQADTNAYDYITGCWSLRVQNMLTGNAATANNVDVYVWKYADSDFELVGLTGNNISYTPVYDIPWAVPVSVRKDDEEFDAGECQAAVTANADGTADGSPPELQVADKPVTMEESSDGADKAATSDTSVFQNPVSVALSPADGKTYGDWQFHVKRKYMDLHTCMRRYTKIWAGTMATAVPSPPVQNATTDCLLTFDGCIRVTPCREATGDDLLGYNPVTSRDGENAVGGLAGGQIPPQGGYSKGVISWFSDMFRFWRGSMRYKLQWTAYPNNPRKMWAVYLPNQLARTIFSLPTSQVATPYLTTPIQADIPQNIAQFIAQNLGSYGMLPGGVATGPANLPNCTGPLNTASLHVSWADYNCGELSIEVPFFTHTGVRMCGLDTVCQQNAPITLETTQGMPPALNNAAGTLYFGTVSFPGASLGANQATYANLYQAVGDDFHMGCLLPPPPDVGISGYTTGTVSALGAATFNPIYPDTYAATTGVPWSI